MRHTNSSCILACLALSSLAGCTSAVELDRSSTEGTIDLSLIGTSPSGTTYRLRDAVLTVAGPAGTRTFRSEEHLADRSIEARFALGPHTLAVADGWRLERLDADGHAATVVASLVSPSPLPFEVVADRTPVVLQFRTTGEVVALTEGDVGIEIGVEEVSPVPQALIVNPVGQIQLTEGFSTVMTVALAATVTSPVVVRLATDDPKLVVSPATLTFDASTGNVRQLVTVLPIRDEDADDEGITLTVSSGELAPVELVVLVDDVEIQAIDVSREPLALTEGETTTITVGYRHRIQWPTVMTVSSSHAGVTVTPTSFSVTPETWATPTTLTLTAVRDLDLEEVAATVWIRDTRGSHNVVDVAVDDTSTEVFLGYPVEGVPSRFGWDRAYAQAFEITADGVSLTRVGAFMDETGPLGVYSDVDDHPGTVLCQGEATRASASEAAMTLACRVSLPPGRYWLAIAPRREVDMVSGSSVRRCNASIAIPGMLPHFATWQCGTSAAMSLFAVAVR